MSCASKECEQKKMESPDLGLLFLVFNIFGQFGDRLVDGYCHKCAQKNLARAWMGLVILISTLIAFIELPWKGPLFAIGVVGVWTGICWSWLFPKE